MMTIQQRFDDSIDIAAEDSKHRITYRHGPALPKPCVHPIATPLGVTLTGFEMSDHVWHRGLWFTIKFVNGENFWEEGDGTGVQTSAVPPMAQLLSANASRITHRLNWTSAATGLVIREIRTMEFARRADGAQCIDWTSELNPEVDLELDRTPYTTWGGYGGLAFRASREMHEIEFLLPGGESVQALTGQKHDWTLMRASADGGPKRKVSIGIIDHPSNPRGQSPWYNKCAGGFAFMNAAFLFNEPMSVKKGNALRFHYRILYRDGLWTADEFAAMAAEFRATEVKR